jgi:cytosine/adenosine deaminase-related metal-dependent hydrolase
VFLPEQRRRRVSDQREHVDILVRGAHVLTMDDDDRIFSPGAVAIRADRIVGVGPDDAVAPRVQPRETIDARQHAVLPGLVDAYSHAGHGLIKAIHTPRLGWPSNRLYFHATTPQWWEAEAQLSALERIRFGTTAGLTVLGATPARADDAAYADAHMRGVLRAGIREILSIGPPDPFVPHLPSWETTDWRSGRAVVKPFTHEQSMAVTSDVVRRWHRSHDDRCRVAVHPPYLLGRFAVHPRFPHAYRPEDLPKMIAHAEEMRAFADAHEVLIHTHAFKGSLAWGARHLGERFWDVLAEDVLLAHANGLTPEEVALAGRAGCAVVWVPTTDENINYGVCPIVDLAAAGVRVAVATDGAAPYMSLNLWKELHRAMFLQRMDKRDPAVLPPGRVLRMVTIEAAAAVGWDREIGSLEVGKRADLITVDMEQPHLTPRAHIPQLLAYYAEGLDVSNVICDGRVLMRERRIVSADVGQAVAWAQSEAEAAFARLDVRAWLEIPKGFWRSHIWPG